MTAQARQSADSSEIETVADSTFSSSSSCFEGDSFDLHSSKKMTFALLKQHLIKTVSLSTKIDGGLQKHALSSSVLSGEPFCRSVIQCFTKKSYFIPEAIYLDL